jgi:hypothetical protein
VALPQSNLAIAAKDSAQQNPAQPSSQSNIVFSEDELRPPGKKLEFEPKSSIFSESVQDITDICQNYS